MSNNDDVPAPVDGVAAAVAVGNRAAAARRGGGGGFRDLRNRRFRIAFYYTVWGGAGIIMSTSNVPSHAVNPGHLMLNILLVTAGVNLFALSMAAADGVPWMEPAAARLEGILARMIRIDF